MQVPEIRQVPRGARCPLIWGRRCGRVCGHSAPAKRIVVVVQVGTALS